VLATGLIVDDAIVVIENIYRKRKEGIGRLNAAIIGTKEVFFAVIATTATLVAVFIPIAFLPGETGILFREFALVLSVSVSISAFVALTLCAMLSSKLPAESINSKHKFHVLLKQVGSRVSDRYFASLDFVLEHRGASLMTAILIAIIAMVCFINIDKELVPSEDRGFIRIALTAPDGASLAYSNQQTQRVEEILYPYQKQGLIKDIYTTVGRWDKNRVDIIATLGDWSQRDYSQKNIAAMIEPQLINIPVVQTRIIQENSLNISGLGAGLRVALLGDSYGEILDAANKLRQQLMQDIPEINDIIVDFNSTQPELEFTIDREKANDLKVSMRAISETLQSLVDKNELFDINVEDQAIPVIVGSDKTFLQNPRDILNMFVPNADGKFVSLSELIVIKEQGVSSELDRIDQRRAIELDIGLVQDASLNNVVKEMQTIASSTLSSGITLTLLGEAAKINETSHEFAIVFVVAVLVVFLVLAAQFESWGSALIVMFTLPFSLSAVVFALIITGKTLNLYSQIGLILLVGLMTKNAILLVEFMEQMRDDGMQISDAIKKATRIRLRPIVMTVLATVLGSIPLIVSTGAGSEARAAIGWVVLTGLSLSTIFTLYLTPLGYSLIAPYFQARNQTRLNFQAELDQSKQGKDKHDD
jgi:multidrug efflux pump subunit AcrB